MDARAREEYRRRLDDLRHELDEAESFNDSGRAARAREEIGMLEEHLGSALGLGGRSRRSGLVAEKARKGVTGRIREAIDAIRGADPSLALHLSNSIRLGTFCSYNPERPISWVL